MSSVNPKRNFAVIQQLHLQKTACAISPPHHSPKSSNEQPSDGSGNDDRSMVSSKSSSSVTAALANENKNALWLVKRPVLKAFLHHVVMLLELLPFNDYDAYVRELQATIEDCLGTQRYKRATQAAHHIQQHRRNAVLSLAESEDSSHASLYSSIVDIEDRTAAGGTKFFWEDENLRKDDLQLKLLLNDLAAQTCHARSVLQVEAKLDRLIEGYFTLRVRTYRCTIAQVIGNSHWTDTQLCAQFFDLFAINYFNSETYNQFTTQHPPLAQNHSPKHHSNAISFVTTAAHTSPHHHGGVISHNASPTSPIHRTAVGANSTIASAMSTSALSPQKRRETHALMLLNNKAIV